ncbi:MAG: recombinase family protein, partial [Burkholderiales bacterium]
FNSLDAQREACAAFILSQRHEGWVPTADIYDDGGYSGGNMERPALKALLGDIALGKVDVIVVYKVDRLTRSLADFAKIVEVLDAKGASFVSVTQSFNTTSSMGRLTLNVLLSFAQFEREVTGERIRDKIAASKAKGMWMGGPPPLGYNVLDRKLVVNGAEADTVRHIFERFIVLRSGPELGIELELDGIRSKARLSRDGRPYGSARISRGALYSMLQNRLYVGEVSHKGQVYKGQHDAIVDREIFDAAQATLAESRVERRLGDGSPDPSLLAGLLWDGDGRRMSPSHSTRGSRRYRYYVSRADDAEARSTPIWRVSARDIEAHVLAIVTSAVEEARHTNPGAGTASATEIERAQASAVAAVTTLGSDSGREQRRIVLDLVQSVELHLDQMRVSLALQNVDPLFEGQGETRSVAISCVRSSKQLKLVLPPAPTPDGTHKNAALIKLVTQA